MIDVIKQDARERMRKSLDSLKQELSKIRTGRAHTSLLDHVTVSYYGSEVPIYQVANVNVEDARTLSITPWEKDMVGRIEKAIMNSDLGLNPTTAGTVIRIPLPALTEERRKELVKVARHEAESARIAVRNIRRDANAHLKDAYKDKEITEDEEHKGQDAIQSLTDQHIEAIDAALTAKEHELMEV